MKTSAGLEFKTASSKLVKSAFEGGADALPITPNGDGIVVLRATHANSGIPDEFSMLCQANNTSIDKIPVLKSYGALELQDAKTYSKPKLVYSGSYRIPYGDQSPYTTWSTIGGSSLQQEIESCSVVRIFATILGSPWIMDIPIGIQEGIYRPSMCFGNYNSTRIYTVILLAYKNDGLQFGTTYRTTATISGSSVTWARTEETGTATIHAMWVY